MHPRCICNLLLMVTIHIYIQLGGDHLAYAHPLTVQPSQGLKRGEDNMQINVLKRDLSNTTQLSNNQTIDINSNKRAAQDNPSTLYKSKQSNNTDSQKITIFTDYRSIEVQNALTSKDEEEKGDTDSLEDNVPQRTEPCPMNFLRHKDSCYHITKPSQISWAVADTYCKLYNSKLVEIDSKSEQNFIESLIRLTKDNLINAALEAGKKVGPEFDYAYWIGATNRAGQAQWKWEASGRPLNFQQWVSKWSGYVDEIESPSCALIDTSESHQWMFWPCAKDFFMTGKRHTISTKIGFICEKESMRARNNKSKSKKEKRRRRQRRKGRRNFHRRHWRKFL